jgi:hypothetical protein
LAEFCKEQLTELLVNQHILKQFGVCMGRRGLVAANSGHQRRRQRKEPLPLSVLVNAGWPKSRLERAVRPAIVD